VAIWYSLSSFVIFFPIWYVCTKRNLATLHLIPQGGLRRDMRSRFSLWDWNVFLGWKLKHWQQFHTQLIKCQQHCFILRYKISHLGTQCQVQVHNFKSRYTISHPGTQFQIQVHNFKSRYTISKPGTLFQIQVHNFKSRYTISNPGTQFQIQVHNFKSRFTISSPYQMCLLYLLNFYNY
jgi:hypothetical protein